MAECQTGMRAAMASAHLPPPRFSSTEHAFRVEIFSSFEAAGLIPEEARICQWLSTQGKASIIQLMDFFNLPKTSMHRRISKLVEDGWIVSHGSGRGTYYIVGDGSISEGGTITCNHVG
jgi:predicted HTH transcriptional regulator